MFHSKSWRPKFQNYDPCPGAAIRGVHIDGVFPPSSSSSAVDGSACASVHADLLKILDASSIAGHCFQFQLPRGFRWRGARHGQPFRVRFVVDGVAFERDLADSDSSFAVRSYFDIDDSELDALLISTNFSDEELRLLYAEFLDFAWPRPVLLPEAFVVLYPAFASTSALDALFEPSPRKGTAGMKFARFAGLLSVAERGSLGQRARQAFELLNRGSLKYAHLATMLDTAQSIAAVMAKLGLNPEEIGEPSQSLSSLFVTAPVDGPPVAASGSLDHGSILPPEGASSHAHGPIAELAIDAFEVMHDAVERAGDALHVHSGGDAAEAPSGTLSRAYSSVGDLSHSALVRAASYSSGQLSKAISLEGFELIDAVEFSSFVERAQHDVSLVSCFGLAIFLRRALFALVSARLPLRREELSGFLQKQKGNTFAYQAVSLFSYDKRWVVIRDGFIAWYRDRELDLEPRDAHCLREVVVQCSSDSRYFLVEAPTLRRWFYTDGRKDTQRWVATIRANRLGDHRFQSFAPQRAAGAARWFTYSCDYFEELLRLLPLAKRRVMIAGWYISPGLLLRRGMPADLRTRLDNVLVACAERNVQVYIMIWNASDLVFDLQSGYVVSHLMKLHPNIKVMRHPYVVPVTWSHHQKLVAVDEVVAFVGGVDLAYGRYDTSAYALSDPDGATFPGRDYNNLVLGVESNGPTYSAAPNIKRESMPRMPWHDVHVQIVGEAARDAAWNFVQRWNLNARSSPNAIEMILPLAPDPSVQQLRELVARYELPESNLHFGCLLQMVRSASSWSAGLAEPERSVYMAILHYIERAQHYIYIENQYFISSMRRSYPKNRVLRAIYKRVKRAILQKDTFRVIILLPVFPAGNLAAASTRYIIKHVYKSISRSEDSLFARLKKRFPSVDLTQYVKFFSLRAHGMIGDRMHTEQVYVHAKLLLVDDLVAVVGSANINDRSLLGTRDSELCVVVEQSRSDCSSILEPGVMNGRPHSGSRFVRSLRLALWNRYLGLEPGSDLLIDPVSEATFQLLRNTALSNTAVYNAVFPTVVPDNVRTLADLQRQLLTTKKDYSEEEVRRQEDAQRSWELRRREKLRELQGILVDFSTSFLEDEHMTPTIMDAEYLLPRSTFL
jgi:phosphatidylserine/phosphatidylglycerophosphate/cardiolipin synthase-like enzyme